MTFCFQKLVTESGGGLPLKAAVGDRRRSSFSAVNEQALKQLEGDDSSKIASVASNVKLLFKKMVDPSMFRDVAFDLYFVAQTLKSIAVMIPFLHIPSLMLHHGGSFSSMEASVALSILGAANGTFRLLSGITTYFPNHVLKVITGCKILAGTSIDYHVSFGTHPRVI